MIMTFHLPIHMTDRSGDSLSPVAIRTSGSVVGEGRLRFKSGRCTISRSKSLPAQVDATAEIFETGFAFVWRLFRQHPLMRLLGHPEVTAAISGPDQPEHIEEVCGSVGWSLPEEARMRLDDLSAPEVPGSVF